MKQNHNPLYLFFVCLFALALPIFDFLEYTQQQNLYHYYESGYLIWFTKPILIPLCSLFFGFFLIRFLGLQNPKRKVFRILTILLICYIISIIPWSLFPFFKFFHQSVYFSTYLGTMSSLINEVDFLPALFVTLGMGYAYFGQEKQKNIDSK